MAEKAIQIAPKVDKEIKSKVSRKLNKKHKVVGNPISDTLAAIAGVFMIIPCLLYGMFVFVGTGFKAGLEAALKMYEEGIKGAKGWAR